MSQEKIEKKAIRSYRDLIVWQKAHKLAKNVLYICKGFPKTDEAKIVKGQIIRSSTSVPANIAEGFGANKGRVFQNSLTIARREVGETDYWLLLSSEIGYINKNMHKELESGYQEVRAMLSSMISKMQ
jgi:four helix bundle protein